jgi:ribonuclease P protein component
MTRATFQKTVRVRSQKDFERARKTGRTVTDQVLRVTFAANGLGFARLGLAVPKRGSAIERNRIKRVIREVFRLRKDRLPPGFDIVVSPKDYERAQDFDAVGRSFDALLAKSGTAR